MSFPELFTRHSIRIGLSLVVIILGQPGIALDLFAAHDCGHIRAQYVLRLLC